MCGIFCLIQCGGKPIKQEQAEQCLDQLTPRGPDKKTSSIIKVNEKVEVFLGFTRLAIRDTSDSGQQPFKRGEKYVICNGEIYNYLALANKYKVELQSHCDCEVILPLYEKVGMYDMVKSEFDAEFAMVLLDAAKIYAARDKYGVRPLYYGYNETTQTIGFASELKALHPVMEYVYQVKPNKIVEIDLNSEDPCMQSKIKFTRYHKYSTPILSPFRNKDIIHEKIRILLSEAVKKRLDSDRPIGFLLSGGLDSSLIVAIATELLGPENIVCFSIGLPGSPDVEAAKKVVKHLQIKQHHLVPFSIEEGIRILREVIFILGTYDITTIRASTPQYLIAKFIAEHTEIKVILSGEGSDEISAGYKYFRSAPDAAALQRERVRLLKELYMFDNKRSDRTMAQAGLELRVPFLDHAYVDFILSIDPSLLMYRDNAIEKQIVRDSFKGYLPDEILYRPKEAFSDAVSSKEVNWYQSIAKHAEETISDAELENNPFTFNKPPSKEALYYRRIFSEFYPNRDDVLIHYWMPRFQGERKITDPSATIL